MSVAGDFLALAGSPNAIGPVCEITLNDATWNGTTTLNLSSGIASARGKGYVPWVEEWDDPEYGFDLLSSNLTPLEASITVRDEDHAIRDAIEGGDQRGSSVAWYWVIPGSAADYAPTFVGMLDSWEFRPGQAVLRFRTNDGPLRTQLPNWTLQRSEWPNLPTAEMGKSAPLIYGVLNSSGLTGTGQVVLIPVNWVLNTTGWYLVCIGEAKLVRNVYVGGVLKTVTTHYTIDYAAAVAGKTYTLVKFTSGNIPAATAVVTADVDGYESTGNTGSGTTAPSGTLFINPVEQIRHLIVSHAENRYGTGAWVTTTSLLDESSWSIAANWAQLRKLEGAGYVGGASESRTVGDILNSWLDTWRAFRACWTYEGKVGLYMIDPAWPGYRDSASDVPVLRTEHEQGEPGLGSFSYKTDPTELADTIAAAYLYDEAAGTYAGNITCNDPSVGEYVMVQSEQLWSIRRAV
jgi:hypothetical protein